MSFAFELEKRSLLALCVIAQDFDQTMAFHEQEKKRNKGILLHVKTKMPFFFLAIVIHFMPPHWHYHEV